jgi:integrase/recombinase XerD
MSPRLDQALTDYLALRRAMGFHLDRAQKLLTQFIGWLDEQGLDTITTACAMDWATLPADAAAWWWQLRMSAVRGFATYLHARDPRVEIPPPGLIRGGAHRATPYLYSEADIVGLLNAAGRLPRPLGAATYQALIGLLAVTGMRVGEAISLDRDDLDTEHDAVLTIRAGKFGKARLVPLHPSTVAALRGYLRTRDRLLPQPATPALLISTTGTRLGSNNVWRTFHRLVIQTALTSRSASCRPRIHDLRHSFAVRTMLDGYARGDDVQALLPRLSTYLGHTDPKHTYWYLSAAPELLALAQQRLETHRQAGHE